MITFNGPSTAIEIERTISKRQAYAIEIPNPSGIVGGSTLSSISKLKFAPKTKFNMFRKS